MKPVLILLCAVVLMPVVDQPDSEFIPQYPVRVHLLAGIVNTGRSAGAIRVDVRYVISKDKKFAEVWVKQEDSQLVLNEQTCRELEALLSGRQDGRIPESLIRVVQKNGFVQLAKMSGTDSVEIAHDEVKTLLNVLSETRPAIRWLESRTLGLQLKDEVTNDPLETEEGGSKEDVAVPPTGTAERAAYDFFSSWKSEDWAEMSSRCQRTWRSNTDDEEERLKSWFGFKKVRGFSIVEVDGASPVMKDVTVRVQYDVAGTRETVLITARVICEVAAYNPNTNG